MKDLFKPIKRQAQHRHLRQGHALVDLLVRFEVLTTKNPKKYPTIGVLN
jgi:hypothetical protein